MSATIKPATAEHGDGMLALMPRLAAFDLPASRNPEHLWLGDAKLLKQWLAGDATDRLVHVALDNGGQVIGLAMVTLRPELLSHEPSAHLEAIAVAEGQEGRGVGGQLLQSVETAARACGALSMSLHAFATNKRACAFYSRLGYDAELLRYIKPLPPG